VMPLAPGGVEPTPARDDERAFSQIASSRGRVHFSVEDPLPGFAELF
jgi:hypothetical protein